MNSTRFPYSPMDAIASGLRTTPQLSTDLLCQACIEPFQRKRSPRRSCLALNKQGKDTLLTGWRMKARATAETADHSIASGEYLVEGFGWGVRRMAEAEDEMRKVAAVQAEAFHVPVSFFNDVFFEIFRAEVFSALIYKIRNSPPDRRKKVGTVLLKACDELSRLWGHDYIALRAYEDDSAAQQLYSNAGFKIVSRDPHWITWVGRKRRLLMIKSSTLL